MKRLFFSLFLLATLGAAAQTEIMQQPIDREANGPTRQLYRYLR